MTEIEFEIDRNTVFHYFLTIECLSFIGLILLFSFPVIMIFVAALKNVTGTAIAFLCCLVFLAGVIFGDFKFSLWLCPQQANNLRYRLEGNTLREDGGVFFLFRKSIPLERITDINLVQGPLLRFFGIWAMRIQTAGSDQCEATLYGVREPEKVRTLILAQRHNAHGEKAGDA